MPKLQMWENEKKFVNPKSKHCSASIFNGFAIIPIRKLLAVYL